MNLVQTINQQHMLRFEDGFYNSPWDEGDRALVELETEFIEAYEAVFGAIKKVGRLEESGSGEAADLAMSKWVDPTRVIPVVIRNFNPCFRELIPAIQEVLKLHPKHAVLFMRSPSRLVVLGGGALLVSENLEKDFIDAFDLNCDNPTNE